MKKMIRTDLRRTLALLMSALMIVSAWVFVAPDVLPTAEAATIESRSLSWSVSDSGDDEISNLTSTIYYSNANGGASGSTSNKNTSITGVPYKVHVEFDQGRKNNANEVYVTISVTVNYAGTQVYSGSKQQKADQNAWGTGEVHRSMDFEFSAASDVASVGINTEPSGFTTPGSTEFKFYPADAYGKRLGTNKAGTPSYTFYANGGQYSGDEVSVSLNTSGTYDVITISVPNKMEDEDVLNDCYVVVSYGSVTGESAHFTITDPQYTQTIASNDSTNYGQLYSSETDHSNDKKVNYGSTFDLYYYDDIGAAGSSVPVDGVLAGYTFKGMYTSNNGKKTGIQYWDRDANGVPVKDENGKYVSTWSSTNGNLSGTKLVSDYKVTSANTWYAAWQANPIKITVKDYRSVGKVFYGTYSQTISGVTGSYLDNSSIAPSEYQRSTYKYELKGWKIKEYSQYNSDGTQAQTPDFDTIAADTLYTTANMKNYTPKGDIVIEPYYEIKGEYNTYSVTFHNTNGTKNDGVTIPYSDYRYGDTVESRHLPVTQTSMLTEDATYTYTFQGWTQNVPASGYYHMYDTQEAAAAAAEGFDIVRSEQHYYPVWYRTYKTYTVNFKYVPDGTAATSANASGDYADHKTTTYHYGDPIVVPNLKPLDENNVPVPYSYTYDGTRYKFVGWDMEPTANCEGDAEYYAVYGNPETAVYTIKFIDNRIYGTDAEPFLIKEFTGIQHHANLNLGSFDPTTLAGADKDDVYDMDGYRYTFMGYQTAIQTSDITSDATYVAKWSRKIIATVQFYNDGEYISGADITGIEGDPIAYAGATPSKEPDALADNYAFVGWQDSNGNTVNAIPANTDSVKLYAKYDITYHDYTITFKNDQGDTILEKTDYHYGDTVVEPTEAQRAKPQDNLYNYTFTRWDKNVVDVKEDATYTAIYLSAYNYYDVQWLNDDGSVYSASKYIYNERISTPFAEPTNKNTYQQPPEGFTLGFLGWQHIEGNVPGDFYSRSDRCGTEGAVYIAVFGNVADLKTVTFYDETGTGDPLGTITVEYNSTLADNEAKIPTATKAPDADKHYVFDKWVQLDDSTFSEDAEITTDINLKATFTNEAHTWAPKKVTLAPTFTTAGTAIEACPTCGVERNVNVAKLADTIAPTVKLTVRDLSWNSTAPGGAVNQVAPTNLLSVATKDTAEIDANYNPSGDGSMVQTIEAVIMKEDSVRAIADIDETEWFIAYTRAENDTGNANTADLLRLAINDVNSSGLGYTIEHGDKFVVYIRATDLNGNTTYVCSSVLQYDTNPPDLIIGTEEEFYNQNRTIFCGAATITVDTDAPEYTLTINDTAVTPTNDQYTLRDAGYYAITAKDVAGNSITKNIEIKANHSYTPVTIAATCTEPGSTYNVCSICNNKTTPVETDPLGHDTVVVTVDPTCAADGYSYDYCRRCNTKVGNDYDTVPAFGHVYPDDAEVYGENAGQTAWKESVYLRKDATCSSTGTAYYVCQLCGEQKTETLDIDPDAHSYYRGVTTQPTCTEDGYITYTCRYDSAHVKTITKADGEDYAYLAATGHKEGDWREVAAATCAAAGSRVKVCSVCGVDLPETTEEIPALAPHYVAVVTPPTETDEGYTTYTCDLCGGTVEGHQYVGDYVDPLVRVTIGFENDDGTEVASFSKLKGETIAEADVPTPTKASDTSYNYTFAGWVDSEEQPVTFPVTAGDDDLTFTATYTSRYINYTLILNRPDDTVFKKLGYQHNDGATIDLAVGPAKESSDTTDYSFDGWYYKYDSGSGVIVDSEVFTSAVLSNLIAAGIFNDSHEATLYPHYEETARQYTVVFGYDTDNILATVYVGFGETAVYPEDAPAPVKAYDELGHYTWSGSWSADITNVLQNMFVKPVFTKFAHDYTAEAIPREGEAQCTEPEQVVYTCACGYTYTQTTATAPGHTWSDGTDGTQVCLVCGAERDDETLYTIAFMVDGTKLKSYNLKYGETFSPPADPTKASDSQYNYTFAYWYTTDEETAVEVATTCTGDITYTAKFNQTPRTFSVAFGYSANNILKTYTDIPYGTGVTYDGPEPVKASDANKHYTFTGWNKDTSSVTEDMAVYATFSSANHTFDDGVATVEATCEQGPLVTYTCTSCGYSYQKAVGRALGHDYSIEVSRVNPTASADGYKIMKCSRCNNETRVDLPRIYLKVTVKDNNHNAVSGVTVSVYDGSTFIGSGVSDGNGVATILVPEAKTYRIVIEGKEGTVTVDENGRVTNSNVPTVDRNNGGGGNSGGGCSCTCHKSGIWPTIFRFFHKIIKMLTGEFRCCPDANY